MVAGIALTYLTQDRQGQRDYWRRVADFKRISPGWYAVILLTVPAVVALAALLDVLFGGHGARLGARFQSGGELFALTERADFYQIVVWAVVATAVVVVWGPRTLVREGDR